MICIEEKLSKLLPWPHREILVKSIKHFFTDEILKESVVLEGGTSLMIKYIDKKWKRPSFDIDLKFPTYLKRNKILKTLIIKFEEIKKEYERYIIKSNNLEIKIKNTNGEITRLKVDFYPFNCFYLEDLSVDDITVPKLIDEIIFLGKLARLKERYIMDINFLLRNNLIDIYKVKEIIKNCDYHVRNDYQTIIRNAKKFGINLE
jgi:predicted nucleotidyltransferase component of viral defense system